MMFESIETHKADPNFRSLVSELSNVPPNLFPYRGYLLMDREHGESVHHVQVCLVNVPLLYSCSQLLCTFQKVSHGEQRPIWFVYSGMGTQWIGMGQSMMKMPMFKEIIEDCSKALRPKGVDPLALLMKTGEDLYSHNTMHSMTCITAIQVCKGFWVFPVVLPKASMGKGGKGV